MRTIAVVGASVAGASFVAEARALGFTGRIVVVDADPDAPYDRPPLSKEFLASADQRPAAPWWSGHGELLAGRAVALDAAARQLHVERADGGLQTVSADHIVIATGAEPARFPGEPRSAARVRTARDARLLRSGLRPGAKTVIVGAGTIGMELASSLSEAGCQVTVIDRASHPLDRLLGGHLADQTRSWLQEAGVRGLFDATIDGVLRDRRGWSIGVDGAELRADVLVSAVGARPCTEWLDGAGLDVRDGLRCDEDGRVLDSAGTPLASFHAAGDVAAWRGGDGVFRRREDWTSAERQGRHIARTLLGGATEPVDREPAHLWTHQFGRRIQLLGEPVRDGELVQHLDAPQRKAAFYTIESAARTAGWLAINAPREFAMAMRDALRAVS